MPTQNNHSGQDMQQQPISHASPWADWYTLRSCQITGWQTQQTLAPMYAGQPVATYDTLLKIWVPATVICILPWSSYLVRTSNGSTYCHMQRHLCEWSVKPADTVPIGTTATLQALSSHCFLAAHPASPPPAPCLQPTPAAPATPAP